VLDGDLKIVLAWSSEDQRRAALTRMRPQIAERLPSVLEETVRELTAVWSTDSVKHSGLARPVPFLVVRTRPCLARRGCLPVCASIVFNRPIRSRARQCSFISHRARSKCSHSFSTVTISTKSRSNCTSLHLPFKIISRACWTRLGVIIAVSEDPRELLDPGFAKQASNRYFDTKLDRALDREAEGLGKRSSIPRHEGVDKSLPAGHRAPCKLADEPGMRQVVPSSGFESERLAAGAIDGHGSVPFHCTSSALGSFVTKASRLEIGLLMEG
jgi:hypothetical protein